MINIIQQYELFFVGFPSGGGGNPITGAGPGGFKAVKNDLIAEVRILFFKFSHNICSHERR